VRDNNPFANRKTVYYDVSDMDNIVKYEDSDREEQPLFKVPLLFIYKNEITGSFAQFELEDVNPNSTPLEAIELFMQRVLEFGKAGAKPLPGKLLEALTDAELDLFLRAHVSNHYYEKIRELIYIQKENDYYQDRFGFTYYIAAVGVKDAVLWFEQNEEILTLHTTPEQLQYPGEKLSITQDNAAEHSVNIENLYEE